MSKRLGLIRARLGCIDRDKIFATVIPRTIRLSEAPSFGKTIFDYDNLNPGSTAYRNLAKEVIERFKLGQK